MNQPTKSVRSILAAIGEEEVGPPEDLLPLVYEELRKLASRRLAHEPAQGPQTTDLVHEAYLRLVGHEDVPWNGRAHFFAAAAEAMRRILVEHARKRGRIKHGGGRKRVPLDVVDVAESPESLDLLALEEALEDMKERDPRMHEIVMLRFFAGLSVEDTALAAGISPRTVKRDWNCARAWLYQVLCGDQPSSKAAKDGR
jgi:RNA polymerase sigma factor (TIGR02999 family)